MALPGTPGQRISDLCNGNHVTQKELAEKIGEHEAEIEKIKNVFLSILRDIKNDIDSGEQPGETVTAAMLQNIQNAAQEQQQELHTLDDVDGVGYGTD